MTDIDWSKAPEGFPVWIESHYKSDPSNWHVRAEKGYKDRKGGMWFDHQVEDGECTVHLRPEWNGEGLPSVGTVCEQAPRGVAEHAREVLWRKVRIIAHLEDSRLTGPVAVYLPTDGQANCDQAVASCFRPIRTAEQIAADERKQAVEQMCLASMGQSCPPICTAAAEALYEAGYRKVQP